MPLGLRHASSEQHGFAARRHARIMMMNIARARPHTMATYCDDEVLCIVARRMVTTRFGRRGALSSLKRAAARSADMKVISFTHHAIGIICDGRRRQLLYFLELFESGHLDGRLGSPVRLAALLMSPL